MKTSIIKTFPGEKDFDLFQNLQNEIYSGKNINTGKNNPVSLHLSACFVLLTGGIPKARFAYYRNPDLRYEGKSACTIGSYECVDDEIISKEILNFAKNIAKKDGYEFLIGPMEGSTWENYRFSLHNVIENFFMEPYNFQYYNNQFLRNGFSEIAGYFSNIDRKPEFDELQISEYEKLLKSENACVRNLNLNDFENELFKIGKFCIEAFKDNFLYTPISPEYFVSKYIKFKNYFVPELVEIVEKDNEIHGFNFVIPNYNDPQKKSIICKSIARRFDSPFKGLGNYFAWKMNKTALKTGYSEVIHAFILSTNASRQLSGRFNGGAYKEYKLYGVSL